MRRQFEFTANAFSLDAMPEVKSVYLDEPLKLQACGSLHLLLSQWLQAVASTPFTFKQLAEQGVAGRDTTALVIRLLGQQAILWFLQKTSTSTI